MFTFWWMSGRKSCSSGRRCCRRYWSLVLGWFSSSLFPYCVAKNPNHDVRIIHWVFWATETAYSLVFQAGFNQAGWHWNRCQNLPAENKSRSFHLKCIRISSRFWCWRFLAGSWWKGADGFGGVDGTRDSGVLLQSFICLLMVVSCLSKRRLI